MTNEIVTQEESKQLQASNRHPAPSLPIEYVKKSLNIDGAEKASYVAKYKAPPFAALEPEERSAFVTACLYRISVITGCPMPEATPDDHTELDTLEGELIDLFTDNAAYGTLNLEEVALAFRMNATEETGEKVKHWQQVFNLEYFSAVIGRYIDVRRRLENKMQIETAKIAGNLKAPTRTEEEDEKDTKQLLQGHYESFLQGTLSVDFILECEYDYLDKKLGLIQLGKADKEQLMDLGKERRLAYHRERAKSRNDFTSVAQLAVDFMNNVAPASEIQPIKREAKRLAVWDFFRDLQHLGIANVCDVKNYTI